MNKTNIQVDYRNLGLIKDYCWSINKNTKHPYVYMMIGKGKNRRPLYLHRLITGAKKGQHVDHINGDALDNRLCNLRIATASQNQANRGPIKGRILKGVFKNGKNFAARVVKDGIRYYLGTFKTMAEAAKAYDFKLESLYGDFAKLNRKP